jgi:hypothetical protein
VCKEVIFCFVILYWEREVNGGGQHFVNFKFNFPWQEWWDQRITDWGYFFCLSYLPKILLAVVITVLDEAYYKVACWLNDKGESLAGNGVVN